MRSVLQTLVPDSSDLADVLPSERLQANGVAIPEVRGPLRRIPNGRNSKALVMVWLYALGLPWLGVHGPWWLGLLVFLAMGPVHVRFAILMHEAAHKLLFSRKSWNDVVGRWLVAYPAFVPIALYRRSHFAHHREEFGPDEPDLAFYGGYPCTPRDLRRRLWRDALGLSGWKNFRVLLAAAGHRSSAKLAWSILGVQAIFATLLWILTGAWWAWLVFWWLPWMTQWRVLNRLRAIAEHGGMGRSTDRRLTTHDVRQTWLARVWLVPYNTGWHLAHHVDMGVPWVHLPALHRELEAAGYTTEAIRFRSYVALWRAATAERRPVEPAS
jgi:fatty acid desaturase